MTDISAAARFGYLPFDISAAARFGYLPFQVCHSESGCAGARGRPTQAELGGELGLKPARAAGLGGTRDWAAVTFKFETADSEWHWVRWYTGVTVPAGRAPAPAVYGSAHGQ